ncbi:MAG TPA: lysine/arginine/ornithine ABC transporter substrate-binding protein [Beijerinckiaceae bacterium]|jgi:octopine/nopaline transport system substrate-binding protein
MRLRLLGLALLATAAANGALAQGKKYETLKLASEGAYAPWNFTTAGGKLDGFEIELGNDLCARMKVKCEFVAQDWDGIIPALNARKYDAIMAGMSITEKRMEVISFSAPYANAPNGILVEKSSPLAKLPGTGQRFSLDRQEAEAQKAIDAIKPALKGKTIGVQGSTTHAAFADKYLKGTIELREYKSTEAHDLDLGAGRIDGVIADSTTLNGTREKPEFKDYVIAGPGFTGGVLGNGVGIGLRKDDTELKSMFDEAIKAAIADGTVKRLSEKWFKVDTTPQG